MSTICKNKLESTRGEDYFAGTTLEKNIAVLTKRGALHRKTKARMSEGQQTTREQEFARKL